MRQIFLISYNKIRNNKCITTNRDFFYCKIFTKYFSSNSYLLISFISFLITFYVILLQILKPQQLTEFTQYGIKILLRLQKMKQ